MNWTAIVPVKSAVGRKSRLAGALSPLERDALADCMFWHVIAALRASPAISDVVVLSDHSPKGWNGRVLPDAKGGLNCALREASTHLGDSGIVILHGDLPFLSRDDVGALVEAAGCGCAIAPDRHQTGTNGLALRSARSFPFSFGPGSLAAHCAAVACRFALVQRPGLALDIDTPDDLAVAQSLGMALPAPSCAY